jgi:hypothetical protein
MWSKTIGFDPYASTNSNQSKADDSIAQQQAEGIMLIAKMSNFSGTIICDGYFSFCSVI